MKWTERRRGKGRGADTNTLMHVNQQVTPLTVEVMDHGDSDLKQTKKQQHCNETLSILYTTALVNFLC